MTAGEMGGGASVVMSRNCLVWSEGIFRLFAAKEAIRKNIYFGPKQNLQS